MIVAFVSYNNTRHPPRPPDRLCLQNATCKTDDRCNSHPTTPTLTLSLSPRTGNGPAVRLRLQQRPHHRICVHGLGWHLAVRCRSLDPISILHCTWVHTLMEVWGLLLLLWILVLWVLILGILVLRVSVPWILVLRILVLQILELRILELRILVL